MLDDLVAIFADSRPPLTRDTLLSEISRSLRATHPDRAEEMIAEVEKKMLPEGLSLSIEGNKNEWRARLETPDGGVGYVYGGLGTPLADD